MNTEAEQDNQPLGRNELLKQNNSDNTYGSDTTQGESDLLKQGGRLSLLRIISSK
jgi:hypothetical protein